MKTKLKMSKNTLEVLKNFSTINSNILIKPGNKIRTISNLKNVLAEAEVETVFDKEFGIWDLNQFLATVSLFKDPEFEFQDKYVVISSKNSSVKYFYCEPKLLTTTDKDITMPDIVLEFELETDSLEHLMKASNVLSLDDICIRSNGDKIVILVMDKEDSTSNNYSIEVGDNPDGHEFSFYLKSDNLKLLPGTYEVSLSDSIVAHFKSKTTDVQYWIALESDSKFTPGV